MSPLVDKVPTNDQVENLAALLYSSHVCFRSGAENIYGPKWEHVRKDVKAFWHGVALTILSFYAYQTNPVEEKK